MHLLNEWKVPNLAATQFVHLSAHWEINEKSYKKIMKEKNY